MKVLLVILHADPARGGAERYTYDLAAQLLSRGLEVHTAAASFARDWPGHNVLLSAMGLTRSARYRSFLDFLDAHLSGHTYDVVHAMLPVRQAHFYHPHAGIAAMRKRPGPLDLLNRRRRLMGAVESQLLGSGQPPITLCLSRYSLGHFRQHYPSPQTPAETVLNGVDIDRFDPVPFRLHRAQVRQAWGVRDDEVALLCIAQDFRRKGVDLAIRALARLTELPAKLIVIGRDDPRPMQQLAHRLGVAPRVLFPGPVTDPRPAYAAADLFVFPTHHDPCPLVTIESLAMGLPVISTLFNGACEYMTQDLHGHILTDPKLDTAHLAQAIRSLAPPSARSRASEACLSLRPQLSIHHHVDQLLRLYLGVKKVDQQTKNR